MKKCFFLVTLTSICLNISAATFTIDKLSFDTINGNECVVYATNPFNLHGSIDIPSHVEFGGRSFVVTIIRCDAFRGSKISRVKIPDTIKKIEPMAFCGTRVKSVDIPSSVKIIGHDAFRECHRLKVVQLHEGLLQIEPGAFCGCHSLRQIIIPASVRYIGDYCFCECKRLHNAYLLGQPDSCGVGVFIDCNLKTQVPISQLMDSLYLEPMINQMIDQMINRWDSLIEEGYFQTNSFTPMLEPMMQIWQNSNGCKNEIYYTHGDHLGSANWITDAGGKPIQYIHYAPYGELIANKQTIGYDERFKFTGKERDWETGYDYFGARFYDHRKGIWNSVDPLADKYPNVTPYLYCNGNPIMLVDPDGRSTKDVIIGYSLGILTSLIPGTSFLRDTYTPNSSVDYNTALATVDKVSLIVGSEMAIAGASGVGAGSAIVVSGGAAASTIIGAPEGAAIAVGGVAVITGSEALAAGGTMIMANAVSNKAQGYNRGSSKTSTSSAPKSINQLNQDVKKGKVPKGITDFHTGKVVGEQEHVHFKDGSALNKDGTWKHGDGKKSLTIEQAQYLKQNGWNIE